MQNKRLILYNSTMKDKKKVIVITGASSGLGSALYKIWDKSGHIVISLSRTNPNGCIGFIKCDVTKEEQVKQAFQKIESVYGYIDLLVSNAGYGLSGATELLTTEQVKGIFDVNTIGDWLVTKYALPLMDRGSRIVHISSVCALFPLCYRGVYCGTKSAQLSIALSQRMELKGQVDVTTICPADIKTEFTMNRVKSVDTSDRYEMRVRKAMEKIDRNQDRRMNVEHVAHKIAKISFKKKTKPYYIIGWKMKVLYFVMRWLPMSVLLHITEKFYGGH